MDAVVKLEGGLRSCVNLLFIRRPPTNPHRKGIIAKEQSRCRKLTVNLVSTVIRVESEGAYRVKRGDFETAFAF